jgi:hypothetical protein
MTPVIAYFLGIITVIVIIVPFWYIASVNAKIGPVYSDIFCNNIKTGNVVA